MKIAGEKQKDKDKERDRLGSTNSVSSKISASSEYSTASSVQSQPKPPPERTWIHDIFEGTLTNETRCLCCETVCALHQLCLHIHTSFQNFLVHCLFASSFIPLSLLVYPLCGRIVTFTPHSTQIPLLSADPY